MSVTDESGDVTVLTPATTSSRSLRATVPMSIVRQLKLREGDKLRWQIKPDDGKLVVVVEPLRTENGED